MDCSIYKSLLSPYIDKDINEIDKIELEKHLSVCKECMDEYMALLSVVKNCNDIGEVDIPADFYTELHEKLSGFAVIKCKIILLRLNWKWA